MVNLLSIRLVLLLAIHIAHSSSSNCPDRKWIEQQLEKAHIPGAVIIVINATHILYEEAFGYHSLTPKKPMNIDKSIFALASVSKTFVGTAVMQLVEKELVDLDTDINEYLSEIPKRIFHPKFPSHSITLRRLLSHSASIAVIREVFNTYYLPDDTAFVESLTDVCYKNINPNKTHWLPKPPGTVFFYSNEGSSLAGLVVERVAKMPYIDYVETHILKPLGINISNTGVRLSDFSNIDNLVKHYAYLYDSSELAEWHEKLSNFNMTQISENFPTWLHIPFYGFSIYPAGLLRMSARSLSIYLQMFLKNGSNILRPQSIVEMRKAVGHGLTPYNFRDELNANSTEQSNLYKVGLGWYWQTKKNGREYFGHDGAMPGVLNSMFVNEKNNLGVIVLTNGDIMPNTERSQKTPETMIDIYISLFQCFDNDIF